MDPNDLSTGFLGSIQSLSGQNSLGEGHRIPLIYLTGVAVHPGYVTVLDTAFRNGEGNGTAILLTAKIHTAAGYVAEITVTCGIDQNLNAKIAQRLSVKNFNTGDFPTVGIKSGNNAVIQSGDTKRLKLTFQNETCKVRRMGVIVDDHILLAICNGIDLLVIAAGVSEIVTLYTAHGHGAARHIEPFYAQGFQVVFGRYNGADGTGSAKTDDGHIVLIFKSRGCSLCNLDTSVYFFDIFHYKAPPIATPLSNAIKGLS